MNLNKILSILIVLSLLLIFVLWLVISGLSLYSQSYKSVLYVVVPGALFFIFWGLVTYQLYNCPNDTKVAQSVNTTYGQPIPTTNPMFQKETEYAQLPPTVS